MCVFCSLCVRVCVCTEVVPVWKTYTDPSPEFHSLMKCQLFSVSSLSLVVKARTSVTHLS